ncbi:MAG: hypothetical protein PHF66_05590 [Desulfobacteraceae bacterium]|jgi:hypothetical protein|nr:hypothetical protein [Desulfobacteraceae bacterium]MDD3991089.1 hypothetical protein [Desulfobacteraceae bacterium]
MDEHADPLGHRFNYQPGLNPEIDAWHTAFFIENHLDHLTHPHLAASPEQVRFMVYPEEGLRYYPCSDRMFAAIMDRTQSAYLQRSYNAVLQRILALIDAKIEDPKEKEFLEALIITKYKHETHDEIMIPSRVEKRLMSIFIRRTQIEDPFRKEKTLRNQRAAETLNSDPFRSALDYVDPAELAAPLDNLSAIKQMADAIQLSRLLCAATRKAIWQPPEAPSLQTVDAVALCRQPPTGSGVEAFFNFVGVRPDGKAPLPREPRKILWLMDEAGEAVMDLAVIRHLAGLGHKVIVVFKGGPMFTKADYTDAKEDPVLRQALTGALFIEDDKVSKNELLRMLRSDYNIFVISDGISERLNLILTSTTFARAFKEVNAVVCRGEEQHRRLFITRFQFTQDLFNIDADPNGKLRIEYKPRHSDVIKFSHADLEAKAQAIIDRMAEAKRSGMIVMFYSGIIGSIPGKIDVAKQIMATFIDYLRNQSASTFIINPSEHYEPGMDADDLMYMWEIVQRSGYIDIWRFQTDEDIAKAFELLGRRIPAEWVGKDATYSTGCTKEMKIAEDVQRQYPEMQIIGPPPEKFVRRSEYGIGRMYDRCLVVPGCVPG